MASPLVPLSSLRARNSDDGAHWRASTAARRFAGCRRSGASHRAGDSSTKFSRTPTCRRSTAIELFNPGAAAVEHRRMVPERRRDSRRRSFASRRHDHSRRRLRRLHGNQFQCRLRGRCISFSLNSAGDSIYLISGDAKTNLTGYSHGFSFGAAANGVSFGRYVNSTGEEQFPAQLAPRSARPMPVRASGPSSSAKSCIIPTRAAMSSSNCATSRRARCHSSTRRIRPTPGA